MERRRSAGSSYGTQVPPGRSCGPANRAPRPTTKPAGAPHAQRQTVPHRGPRAKEATVSRIPAWLAILVGLLAIVAGVLGVTHAPNGVPKVFWAVITVLGAASLLYAWTSRGPRSRHV